MPKSLERLQKAEQFLICGSRATTLYFAAKGNPLKAAYVPAVGCAVMGVTLYCENEAIKEVGKAILFGALMSMPGAGAAYAISAIGKKALAAKVIAVVVGNGITDKATDAFEYYVVRDAVRSLMGAGARARSRL